MTIVSQARRMAAHGDEILVTFRPTAVLKKVWVMYANTCMPQGKIKM